MKTQILKRAQAKERQSSYDSLSLEQKLERLDSFGFRANKQRSKIQSQIVQKENSKSNKKSNKK